MFAWAHSSAGKDADVLQLLFADRSQLELPCCVNEMLQHRSKVCEANEAQASCKEVVGIWKEAADMRDGLGGDVAYVDNASSIGAVSDSDVEDSEEERGTEGSVDGGGVNGEEVQKEIS